MRAIVEYYESLSEPLKVDKSIDSQLQQTPTNELLGFLKTSTPTTVGQKYFWLRVARLAAHLDALIVTLLLEDNITLKRLAVRAPCLYSSPGPFSTLDQLQSLFPKLSVGLRANVINNVAKFNRDGSQFCQDVFVYIQQNWGIRHSLPLLGNCSTEFIKLVFPQISPLSPSLRKWQLKRLGEADPELFLSLLGKSRCHVDLNFKAIVSRPQLLMNASIQMKKNVQKNILRNHFEVVLANPLEWVSRFDQKLLTKYVTKSRLLQLFECRLTSVTDFKREIPDAAWLKFFSSEEVLQAVAKSLGDGWVEAFQLNVHFWNNNTTLLKKLPVEIRTLIACKLSQLQSHLDWLQYASVAVCSAPIGEHLRYQSDATKRAIALNILLRNAEINQSQKAADEVVELILDRYRNDNLFLCQFFPIFIDCQLLSETTFNKLSAFVFTRHPHESCGSLRERYFAHPSASEFDLYAKQALTLKFVESMNLGGLPESCHLKFIERLTEVDAYPWESSIWSHVVDAIHQWNEKREVPIELHKEYPKMKSLLRVANTTGIKYALNPRNKIPLDWLLFILTGESLDVDSVRLVFEACAAQNVWSSESGIAGEMLKLIEEVMSALVKQVSDGSLKGAVSLFKEMKLLRKFEFFVDEMKQVSEKVVLDLGNTRPDRPIKLFLACSNDEEKIEVLLKLFVEAEGEDLALELHEGNEYVEECFYRYHCSPTRYDALAKCISLLLASFNSAKLVIEFIRRRLEMPLSSMLYVRDAMTRLVRHLPPSEAAEFLSSIEGNAKLKGSSSSVIHPLGLNKHLIRLRCELLPFDKTVQVFIDSAMRVDHNTRRWMARQARKMPREKAFACLWELMKEVDSSETRLMDWMMRSLDLIPEEKLKVFAARVIEVATNLEHDGKTRFAFIEMIHTHIHLVDQSLVAELIGKELFSEYKLNNGLYNGDKEKERLLSIRGYKDFERNVLADFVNCWSGEDTEISLPFKEILADVLTIDSINLKGMKEELEDFISRIAVNWAQTIADDELLEYQRRQMFEKCLQIDGRGPRRIYNFPQIKTIDDASLCRAYRIILDSLSEFLTELTPAPLTSYLSLSAKLCVLCLSHPETFGTSLALLAEQEIENNNFFVLKSVVHLFFRLDEFICYLFDEEGILDFNVFVVQFARHESSNIQRLFLLDEMFCRSLSVEAKLAVMESVRNTPVEFLLVQM